MVAKLKEKLDACKKSKACPAPAEDPDYERYKKTGSSDEKTIEETVDEFMQDRSRAIMPYRPRRQERVMPPERNQPMRDERQERNQLQRQGRVQQYRTEPQRLALPPPEAPRPKRPRNQPLRDHPPREQVARPQVQKLRSPRERNQQGRDRRPGSTDSFSFHNDEWRKLERSIMEDLGVNEERRVRCRRCGSEDHTIAHCPQEQPLLREEPYLEWDPRHNSALPRPAAPQPSRLEPLERQPEPEDFAFWVDPGISHSHKNKLYYVKGYIGDSRQQTNFLVDTGSAVSILPRRIMMRLGATVQPEGQGTRLVGFSGVQETALGTFTSPVKIGTEAQELTFYIAERAGKPILGVDSLRKLGLSLDLQEGYLVTPQQEKILCHVIESEEQREQVAHEKGPKNE
eukprot:g7247.t1